MKITSWFLLTLFWVTTISAQTIQAKLESAVKALQEDSQMRHALLGCIVINAETGETILEVNAETGMAPASCQKIITSASIFEFLGPEYRYHTELGYSGSIHIGILKGDLWLSGTGDPSLGSWRYADTKENRVLQKWMLATQKAGIGKVEGKLIGFTGKWEEGSLPGGWIWDDIGNYYGAGTRALNWRENQYDVMLQSGNLLGSGVTIVRTEPALFGITLHSKLTAAPAGTGDNAYIYLAPGSREGIIRGTIPVSEKAFTISGSFPDPPEQLMAALANELKKGKIKLPPFQVSDHPIPSTGKILVDHLSPPLDSLNFWFMKKSINLYGEAFVKTIAYETNGTGSTEKGLTLIKDFWKGKGIDPAALHMVDGSGLSPQNRITPRALVTVLQYAQKRPWFPYYYQALPEYNGMKLKSGTIGGAKGFAGYHTSRAGIPYIVAILINNYEGSAGEIVKKMYRVLDELK